MIECNIGERFLDGDILMSDKSGDFSLEQYLFELFLLIHDRLAGYNTREGRSMKFKIPEIFWK